MILRPITNRIAEGRFSLPADGWWQLVPLGEFPHASSGLVQVIDPEALEQIANRFRPGTLIDFDHFSYDPERPSEAAGWIDQVEVREDGLWAKARWSDVGRSALLNGRYRFVSPTWLPGDVVALGDSRVRPVRLDSAGLTNQPNLRGMAPLTNRSSSPAAAGEVNATETTKTEPKKTRMKTVANRLGLSPDASEEAVLAQVNKVLGERDTAQAELTPIKNRAAALTTQIEGMLGTQADEALDGEFKELIPAEARDHWRGQLIANRAATLATLRAIAPKPATGSGVPVLANRSAGPASSAKSGGADPQVEFLRKVNEFKISNRCSFDEAFTAIRTADPKALEAALKPAAAH